MDERQSLYALILSEYQLTPIMIEEYGKVKKVTTSHGPFALKETSLPSEQADAFIYALRRLTKLGYKQFVPVYPTRRNEYIVRHREAAYYLMPWVEEYPYTANESMEEKLAAQLGIIHRLSVETRPLSEDERSERYDWLLNSWNIKHLELSRYADQVERNTYYSPFELTYLTHAFETERMAEVAKQFLNQWIERCQEKGTFRTVLCHCRLKRSHARFSYENEPYLLNFEQACVDSPARDLALFFRYNIPRAYWNFGEMMKWIERYERHLPLLEEEKYLLLALLNFPEPVYRAVQMYETERETMSEIEHVERLKRRLLALRNVRYLTEKLIASSSEHPS